MEQHVEGTAAPAPEGQDQDPCLQDADALMGLLLVEARPFSRFQNKRAKAEFSAFADLSPLQVVQNYMAAAVAGSDPAVYSQALRRLRHVVTWYCLKASPQVRQGYKWLPRDMVRQVPGLALAMAANWGFDLSPKAEHLMRTVLRPMEDLLRDTEAL